MKKSILLIIIISYFSCGDKWEKKDLNQIKNDSLCEDNQTLGKVNAIGINELRSCLFPEKKLIIGNTIHQSNELVDCIRYLQGKVRKDIIGKKFYMNKNKPVFSLNYNSNDEFFIIHTIDVNDKKENYVFKIKNISDYSYILIPLHLERDSILKPLHSFFYFDTQDEKLLCFGFQNFLNIQDGNYSINNLNTIAFLNSDFYEYYTIYYYFRRAKFSVESRYHYKNRIDKIYIQDSIIDFGKGQSNKCLYQLTENFPMKILLNQDFLKCGVPIAEYPKLINRKVPAWCVKNQIY